MYTNYSILFNILSNLFTFWKFPLFFAQVSFYAIHPRKADTLVTEAVSEDKIIDIGSKDIGALQLHDVTPLKSCAGGGRKVIIVSEYDLSAQSVPIFQLFNTQGTAAL